MVRFHAAESALKPSGMALVAKKQVDVKAKSSKQL